MNSLTKVEEVDSLIRQNKMVLIYFGGESCGVCSSLKPKVEKLIKSYPQIAMGDIEVEKSVKLSAYYSIFTIPVVILFIEGKETIREARHISVMDLEEKISRYYAILYD